MIHPTFLKLAAELLSMAANEFGNHTCNDFKMTGRFTEGELVILADMMNRSNLGPDYKTKYAPDHDDVDTVEHLKDYTCDFALMDTMAFMLREVAAYAEANAVMPANA